ncbi:hypothetical protein [Paenibacillus sp. FSL H8-0034]|uniref:hypothetical protein n=1 Tax=Paenibacillus sp. FSL H8-0034 TaxID=2954671 RepID=UPI0030F813A6
MKQGKDDKLTVTVVRDTSDVLAVSEPVNWAVARLAHVLEQQGIELAETALDDQGQITRNATADTLRIMIAGNFDGSAAAESFLIHQEAAEAEGSTSLLHITGADERGLVYAILELADRVRCSEEPLADLIKIDSYSGEPANEIRSISRSFCSEIEDKSWFYDQTFWLEYLTELATHRFNRFHLTLGISYDYGHDPNVQDNYFGFVYPYFLDVPSYQVRVRDMPQEEVSRNLETLQFISREAKRRGIHFQLGLWNHAYQMADSPNELHIIDGVDESNHAVYCRDGLRLLLECCPDIDGVTLRTHYEGGIPEPSHVFWKEVMKGLTACGRTIEIDMHPKGVDEQMLEVALGTGMPVIVSPKFWAEHMGLPYHQAAIRTKELPVATTDRADLMLITNTYRRFTRYGYADYLNDNRRTGVLHRIWPGTQRVLLWGDPAMAAGYGRSSSFCGSLGVELCEPMSFKARKTSGTSGGRELYKEEALQLPGEEWKKFVYTYRVWGRLIYNPEADSAEWMRYLRHEFRKAAPDLEQALAHASRILLLFTTAHLPSASNNYYWPEMYNNLGIVNTGKLSESAFDTPEPHTFGAVSPLDTAIFYGINEFVDDYLQNRLHGKYTPLAVAAWLEELAETAERHLAAADSLIGDQTLANYRRWSVDIAALAGLGHFFAQKLRAGVSYALFEQTGNVQQLREALGSYRSAKTDWQHIINVTQDVYRDDITFGYKAHMKGHWADRMSGIEEDIADMEQVYAQAAAADSRAPLSNESAAAVSFPDISVPPRPILHHEPPQATPKGEAVELRTMLADQSAGLQISLLYRHVNQAEAYVTVPMSNENGVYKAVIPGSYTDSPYPVLYYFELTNEQGAVWLEPGLAANLSNQPYYVLQYQF